MITIKEATKHLNTLMIPIDTDFDMSDINRAYKYLANLYHPDKNKSSDSNKAMSKINDSYEWIKKYFSEIKKLNLQSKIDNFETINQNRNHQDTQIQFHNYKQGLMNDLYIVGEELESASLLDEDILRMLNYYIEHLRATKEINEVLVLAQDIMPFLESAENLLYGENTNLETNQEENFVAYRSIFSRMKKILKVVFILFIIIIVISFSILVLDGILKLEHIKI